MSKLEKLIYQKLVYKNHGEIYSENLASNFRYKLFIVL